MDRKRIMVLPGAISGGVGSVVMNLLRNVDRKKVQMDFCVTSNKASSYDTEIKSYGCHIYKIPQIREVGFFNYINSIKRILIEKGPYDAVHVHSVHMGALALIAAQKVGIKQRIYHVHNTKDAALENIPFHRFFEYYLKRLIKKNATVYLACGKDAGVYVYGKCNKFNVINNAVQTSKFYPYSEESRLEIRKELGFNASDIVVGNVARFDIEKNQEFLIELVAEDKKKGGRIKIMLVGDGPLMEDVKNRAVMLDCSDRVIFLGSRTDVARMYNAMDVFCLPSFFEGLPVTVIEAQACGVPCLTSLNVTEESNLSVLPYIRLDLKESHLQWLNTIYKYSKDNRTSAEYIKKQFIEKEYEISVISKKIEKYYTKTD